MARRLDDGSELLYSNSKTPSVGELKPRNAQRKEKMNNCDCLVVRALCLVSSLGGH